MKYLKIGIYEICAIAIIATATLLRVGLASQGWPITNSDEGTMGIMTLHIAYHGEHPYMFYGQDYMGSLEAFIGAILFQFFGPSLFTLRLGVILLVTLFLVSMYLLTSLLYSKGLALVTLAILSLGSNMVLTREIMSTGGSSQTLLFGALAFLLAAWLAFTRGEDLSSSVGPWRLIGYIGWGLVVGLGLWCDLVVLPFFAMAGLFLVLFCWRDLWSLAPLCLLLGLLVGASPLIAYNLRILHYTNSMTVLLNLFHSSNTTPAPHGLAQVIHGMEGTILVSLPNATGNPFCQVSEESQYFMYTSPHSIQCTAVHATWGLGYIILWTIATFLVLGALWRLRDRSGASPEERKMLVIRNFARLALLGGAGLAITVYAFSSAPMSWPGIHARYLVGLLIVTPAIISPLWSGVTSLKLQKGMLARVRGAISGGMLLLIAIMFLIGTINIFGEIPLARTINRHQDTLVNDLLRIHATHIYSDYWTCDSVIFQSNERIICVTVDGNLRPTGLNRYRPYVPVVVSDPHAFSVYPLGSTQAAAIEQKVAHSKRIYQRFVFDGYVAYRPV